MAREEEKINMGQTIHIVNIDDQHHSLGIPITTEFFNIPDHNSVDGTLNNIKIRLMGKDSAPPCPNIDFDIDKSYRVENLDSTYQICWIETDNSPNWMPITAKFKFSIIEGILSFPLWTKNIPNPTTGSPPSFGLSAHDGNIDYDGPSGETREYFLRDRYDTTITTQTILNKFIDTSSGIVDLSLLMNTLWAVDSDNEGALSINHDSDWRCIKVEVEYNFT